MVVIEARRKKVIIAIRAPMPADPLNPEKSSYVKSESPIRTCLNRKTIRFRRRSPGRPGRKIGIDPREIEPGGSGFCGLSKKDWSMLRHAQHERILVIVSRPIPFVQQLGRRTPNGFSLTCLLLLFPGTDTSGEISGVRLKAGYGCLRHVWISTL